ncbi:MAG: tRNA uridine-5-carboxymethylaminomethyl(34) synthesis GTPase MnmE, partial [candidate division NC10 bacterium]
MVAVATAMGESAIGVIRVSGPAALAVVTPVLKSSVPLEDFPSHTLRRVAVVDLATGERVDQALCVVMRAPRSATGEDVVELSCHGSPALLRMVTRWLIAGGARLAEPGEFTRRAFLNGRLDLAQAEAVALLISARTERAVALAARALAGGLSERARALREDLLDLVAGLEVTLDFPEEHAGLDVEKARHVVARLRAAAERWAAAARQGHVVHDGITVALVGPPNAGKSSL